MPLDVFVAHPWKVLTDHLPNGDGLVAYHLLRGLAERGHRLHVVCRAVELREPPPPTLHLRQLRRSDDHLRGAERLRYMAGLRGAWKTASRERRFDLVHQLNPVDVAVSLALPPSAGPLVLGPYWSDWPHEVEAWSAGEPADGVGAITRRAANDAVRRVLRAVEQRRAEAVLLTTEAAREKLEVPVREVAVVPVGIDPAAFPVQREAPPGPPTVLFLANLRRHKGVLTLVDAWAEVVERLPDARLRIAGGGPDEQLVRERVAASPASASIELLGPVERSDITRLVLAAHVFCQPAHGEPYGTSAVEAMACGVPVVATNTGGLPHVVPDDASVKVPPRDPSRLAEALADLLGDPERCRRLGAAGRRVVEERYSWDRVVDALEAVYARVLGRPVDA